jgi:hypothetical protein
VTWHIPPLTCTPILIVAFAHQRSRSRKPYLRLPQAKRARAQGPSIDRSLRRSCTRPLAVRPESPSPLATRFVLAGRENPFRKAPRSARSSNPDAGAAPHTRCTCASRPKSSDPTFKQSYSSQLNSSKSSRPQTRWTIWSYPWFWSIYSRVPRCRLPSFSSGELNSRALPSLKHHLTAELCVHPL